MWVGMSANAGMHSGIFALTCQRQCVMRLIGGIPTYAAEEIRGHPMFMSCTHAGSTRARPAGRIARYAAAAAMMLALSACQSSNLGVSPDTGPSSMPEMQADLPLPPDPQGEVFGQGNIRVALLVPKTAPGNAASVANEIRNGALLAMQDFGNQSIQLVIKDTKGQAADAQAAAGEAVRERASIVVGPLFSASVAAASAVTQPAGLPVVAFSTDTNVARRGVYLLSYTPQADVERIISHAIRLGKRNIFAFLPNNTEGNLREAMLRQVAGSGGANVQVFRYERSGPAIEEAARNAAASIAEADTIYIPEGSQIPNFLISSLKRNGAQLDGKLLLGSGQWESVKFDGSFEGALYPGRDVTEFANFAQRYQTTYNSQPSPLAAIGYDAVTLVATLASQHGRNGYTPQILEDRRGYIGINGIFRIRADGTTDRGLAIYRVQGGKGVLDTPAPRSFSAG